VYEAQDHVLPTSMGHGAGELANSRAVALGTTAAPVAVLVVDFSGGGDTASLVQQARHGQQFPGADRCGADQPGPRSPLDPQGLSFTATSKPDKAAINEVLKADRQITGAQLISRRSWRIH
jgi:hypothetical protein